MNRSAPLVAGIGEVLWDKFPDVDRLGGAPANFVFHAAQLGAQARIVSRIGCDPGGSELRRQLEGRGVSTEYLQTDAVQPTGTVLVRLQDGQPNYTIMAPVAWDFLELTGDLKQLASRLDAICFGTLAQRNTVSQETIRWAVTSCPKTALRLFDINLRQSFYTNEIIEFGLRHATVLKLNADELACVGRLYAWETRPENIIGRLFQHFPLEWIALTRGAEGCELHAREQTVRSPAVPVKCVDAVGAGDAFSAMLAVGLLKKLPLQEIADRCNRIGAYVVSQAGAMPELPAELIAF